MQRYREYSEATDNLGYISYRPQSIPSTLEEANPAEFRQAIAQLKQRAIRTRKNLNDPLTLNEVIRDLVQADPLFSNWCRNKSVSILSLFPSARNSQIPVEIAEVIAFFHMISHATVNKESFDDFKNLIYSLDTISVNILKSVKINAQINIRSDYLQVQKKSFEAERFLSLLSAQSFVHSQEAFHAVCANEFFYGAELIIRNVFRSCGPTDCNQFFALRDQQGKTPLIAATIYGMQRATHLILQESAKTQGIDIQLHARDDQGYTAIDYAFLLGYTDLVQALLKAGAQFSSPDVITRSQDPELVAFVYHRAIICPERHVAATHNYLYFNVSNGYPIMVADESTSADSAWRFVVMHPQNPDAITLMATNPEIAHEESREQFIALQQQTSTLSFGEHRFNNLHEISFLRKLIFNLARLGQCDNVVALLTLDPDLDLLHTEDGVNLLHACTNSYAISTKFVPMQPPIFSEIIAGRGRLVAFLIKEHSALYQEKTTTSVGQEDFESIVTRMHGKHVTTQMTLDPASTFNTALYAELKICCTSYILPAAVTSHESAFSITV